MNRKLISLEAFEVAVERREAWLANSWFAFAEEGILVMTVDDDADQSTLDNSNVRACT